MDFQNMSQVYSLRKGIFNGASCLNFLCKVSGYLSVCMPKEVSG